MQVASTRAFEFSSDTQEFRHNYLEPFWERRLVELAALCRLIELECPRLARACGLRAACRVLRRAGPQAKDVLRSPELWLWICVSRYFVMRNMPEALPTGHVRDHLADLQRFAVAAACAARTSAAGRAMVQQDGRIPMPGLGIALVLDRCHVGKSIALETRDGILTAKIGTKKFRTAVADSKNDDSQVEGWVALPRLGWGLLLEGSHELSRPHLANNRAWRVYRADAEYVRRWQSSSIAACKMIGDIEAALWVPVHDVLVSIIPLQSSPQVNLSGTCAEALGCICSSLPSDEALLAETLVHEAAHCTLQILTDDTAYWIPIGDGLPYRSPWRKDLRPISGMIHGIFAFLAVGAFWSLTLQGKHATQFDELGRFRLRTVVRQIDQAISEIRDSSELTDEGRQLLVCAERQLGKLRDVSDAFAPTSQNERVIEETLATHASAVARLLPERVQAPPLRLDAEWSRALGVPMPPPRNQAISRTLRHDTVSDPILLAALKDDPLVNTWEALIESNGAREPESTALVRGAISYGRGDFAAALKHYASYVELRWDDMDAWRLLAAALRRSGRSGDALAVAFDIDEILRYPPDALRAEFGEDWPRHLHHVIERRSRVGAA
jgi:HEXXH motif-containing protein